ncbi:hypothetical protein ABZV67_41030 [Streptomyces sp. NPDC005065]|uniref:hypothetical protein n=1 Tax=Streptomyces sp. NPDC005065 TaxID=3154461 RepID=UPI0033B03E41
MLVLGRYADAARPISGAFAQVATVTEWLGLGTGIIQMAQHDPTVLAQQGTTSNHLPRPLHAVPGAEWNRDEAEDHGAGWAAHRSHARDHLAVLCALRTETGVGEAVLPLPTDRRQGAGAASPGAYENCGTSAGGLRCRPRSSTQSPAHLR